MSDKETTATKDKIKKGYRCPKCNGSAKVYRLVDGEGRQVARHLKCLDFSCDYTSQKYPNLYMEKNNAA